MQVERDLELRGYPGRENYITWETAIKNMINWFEFFGSVWQDEIDNQFEQDGMTTVLEWLFRIETQLIHNRGNRGALTPETTLQRDFNDLVDVIADFIGPFDGGHVNVTPSPTAPVLTAICEIVDVDNDDESEVDVFTADEDIFPFQENETFCLHLPEDGCVGVP